MSQAIFTHDEASHTITVTRRYSATRTRVWKAWTNSALLDLWWGPKPWNAVTKSFDFSEGGHWHYAMTGPDGERHWAMVSYKTIDAENSFTAIDSFCDEQGITNTAFPSNHWETKFLDHKTFTEVIVTLTFDTLEDMRKIIEMGFEQGFTMGLTQLQEVLDTPAASSKKMTWQIQIAAPREKVWKKIFDKETYTIWTSAFCEGSYYEGDWIEGNLIHFLAPAPDGGETSGMVGVVRELRPPEFSSVEHIGIWMDGKMDTSSEEAQAWAPAFENYTLKSRNGGTELLIELDVTSDYKDMFDEIWPKALAKLKEICEQ